MGVNATARQFGTTNASVSRHQADHMPEKPGRSLGEKGVTIPDTLRLPVPIRRMLDRVSFAEPEDAIDFLCGWLNRVEAVADQAQAHGQHELVLKASQQAKSLQDAIAKLRGWDPGAPATNDNRTVNVFAGWPLEKVRDALESLTGSRSVKPSITVESRVLEP